MYDTHYHSLPEEHGSASLESQPPRKRSRLTSGVSVTIVASVIFLISIMASIINQYHPNIQPTKIEVEPQFSTTLPRVGRGVREGVSEKSAWWPSYGETVSDYNWTDAQQDWQRTAFHFQSQKNWINDPDGPLFYMGWYHLFYQYNPDSSIWGNITWGHAVSKDLIHWLYLPLAMVPDQWFDWNGVWTGSATLLPDGKIIMLYTGDTDNYVQVQNLAVPKNLSDPLLLEWDKYSENPVMVPPTGIAPKDFRDPSTAWMGPDGKWRLMIGSKVNGTGIALVYQTTNFTSYELLNVAHSVEGTGMWECVDFYPVATNGSNRLDTSASGSGIKHVLKASLDDTKHDVYALGTYDPVNVTWTPDNPELDVGIGLQVDFGKYYASKTFYDQNKERRILWGWIGETDSDDDDIEKGWSGLESIPRVVTFDNQTGTNILQWPVEEIESLRLNSSEFLDVKVGAGSVVPIDIGSATQLDISAEFAIDKDVVESIVEADLNYNCSGGAVNRGVLGPFGLLTIADGSLSELTPIYFYLAKEIDGTLKTWFCADELRSSKSSSVYKRLYGGVVPVLDGENYSMRVLVDHSVVESFAQGGRAVISSRVYPTEAIYGAAKLFAFNNATNVNVSVSLKIWKLDSAHIQPYPFDYQLISSL